MSVLDFDVYGDNGGVSVRVYSSLSIAYIFTQMLNRKNCLFLVLLLYERSTRAIKFNFITLNH